MCGSVLSLCLLLWIGGACVSRAHAKVWAADVTADVGRPFNLECSVTLGDGDSVRQVFWYHMDSQPVLAYQLAPKDQKVSISHHQTHVQLAYSRKDASAITITTVQHGNEGCYRCVFHIYPSGMQEGRTCLSVAEVTLDGNQTAVSGQQVALSCAYNIPDRVMQVLWKKTAEQGDTATVAYYVKSHIEVKEPFKGRVNLSRSMGDTRLTILRVRTEDEACYTCEFHTYPDGIKHATTCLSVYVLPKPEVSYVTFAPGVIEANCTARSRPAAQLAWDVVGDNRTLEPALSSAVDQGDGTTVVTSTLRVQSTLLREASITCTAKHRGLEEPVSVLLNTND
ncbi:nectin-2-like isoform X2 [Genypterus blacodes]|uniref:nectin-2-like isoform X2 n=1 Tax=Genypterus blacodes TaxID=154954 RepID=UPI003F759892